MNDITNQMNEIQQVMDESPEETKMPFGRYQGKSIEDIPNFYLYWLMQEDFWMENFEYLLIPIQNELKYREQYDIVIKDNE